MKSLSDEPKIIAMAHGLGIHEGDRVQAIKEFCRDRVRALISRAGPVRTIDDLERIVCEKLNITIVDIRTDEDLDALIEKHARQEKDIAFAMLRQDLDAKTFATLIRRKRKPGQIEDHYVAVIDCRGEKNARRFFTRWHEIAHILTLFEQLELPLHRSTVEKDAIEKMMDIIAGDIGFYEPLFIPVLKTEVKSSGRLTFSCVENVRREFCPAASFEATLNACSARLDSPVLVLQTAMGFKRGEERAIKSLQAELIPAEKPVAQLRVVSAVPNAAARNAKLNVHKNMRVPAGSIISKVFTEGSEFEPYKASENLNWWRSSNGDALRHDAIRVEAMKVGSRVWAIITPGSSGPKRIAA